MSPTPILTAAKTVYLTLCVSLHTDSGCICELCSWVFTISKALWASLYMSVVGLHMFRLTVSVWIYVTCHRTFNGRTGSETIDSHHIWFFRQGCRVEYRTAHKSADRDTTILLDKRAILIALKIWTHSTNYRTKFLTRTWSSFGNSYHSNHFRE